MRAFALPLLLCLSAPALAAAPNADRPSVSRTGHLVAADTLEIEAGTTFGSTLGAPLLLKYSVARALEPRLAVDVVGAGDGAPGLDAGAKARILGTGKTGLAAHVRSAIPVGPTEAWSGSVDALFTTLTDRRLVVQANVGLALGPSASGSTSLAGVPVSLKMGPIVGSSLALFGEGAVTLDDNGPRNWILDAGAGWSITEIAVLDAGFGWHFALSEPVAQLGLTVNFGRLGG